MAKKPSSSHDYDDPAPTQAPEVAPDAPAPDPDAPPPEPTQAEKDADKQPLSKEEAEQLLRAGHRLRKKGETPDHWISMTRHMGDMAVAFAATDDVLKQVLDNELLIADA